MSKEYAYVKCCERNKEYIFMTYEDNLFNLDNGNGVIPDHIEYCPWCGILLDTNLLDAHPEAKEGEWQGFGDDGKFGPLDD